MIFGVRITTIWVNGLDRTSLAEAEHFGENGVKAQHVFGADDELVWLGVLETPYDVPIRLSDYAANYSSLD